MPSSFWTHLRRATKNVADCHINIQSHRQTEKMKTVSSLITSTNKTMEGAANYITANRPPNGILRRGGVGQRPPPWSPYGPGG